MDKNIITSMKSKLDALVKRIEAKSIEFWFARDVMEQFGYERWENFSTAINRATASCKTTGFDPEDHFRGVTKMVSIGSDAKGESKGVTHLSDCQ